MLSRGRCSLGCRIGLVAGLLPFMAGVGTLPQRNLSPIIPFSCKERNNIIVERQIQKDDQCFGNDDVSTLLWFRCRVEYLGRQVFSHPDLAAYVLRGGGSLPSPPIPLEACVHTQRVLINERRAD